MNKATSFTIIFTALFAAYCLIVELAQLLFGIIMSDGDVIAEPMFDDDLSEAITLENATDADVLAFHEAMADADNYNGTRFTMANGDVVYMANDADLSRF